MAGEEAETQGCHRADDSENVTVGLRVSIRDPRLIGCRRHLTGFYGEYRGRGTQGNLIVMVGAVVYFSQRDLSRVKTNTCSYHTFPKLI